MKELPLVSVFMTVYNSEKYIQLAIDSLLNQSYRNLELIIIDDGSTDTTFKILEGNHDPRIKLFRNYKNMGIPHNRRKGIELAKGKYLVIMDADDLSMPNRIDEQVKFMEKNYEVLAAGTFTKHFGKKFNNFVDKPEIHSEEIKILLMFFNSIINSSSIIRLDTIKQLGINYNPNYFVAQDYDFWAQLSKMGEVRNIPKVLLKYRFGHNNITKQSNRSHLEQRKKIIAEIRNDLLHFHGFHLTEDEKQIFNDFFDENEPLINNESVHSIKNILNQFLQINNEKQIFDHLVFIKIINFALEKSFKKASIGFYSRYKYWRFLSNRKKGHIFIKSGYFSCISFLRKTVIN